MVHKFGKRAVRTVWGDRMNIIDMTGKQCGYWHVISFSHLDKKQRAYWWCECELCGTVKQVRGDNLRRGMSTKCADCKKGVTK